MISLAGLFLLPDEIFHSMALGTIAVILAAIAGSLTFVPATLAILGDGVSRLVGPVPVAPTAARAGASGPRSPSAGDAPAVDLRDRRLGAAPARSPRRSSTCSSARAT